MKRTALKILVTIFIFLWNLEFHHPKHKMPSQIKKTEYMPSLFCMYTISRHENYKYYTRWRVLKCHNVISWKSIVTGLYKCICWHFPHFEDWEKKLNWDKNWAIWRYLVSYRIVAFSHFFRLSRVSSFKHFTTSLLD